MKVWLTFLAVMLAMALAAECYAKLPVSDASVERTSIALTWAIRKSTDKEFRLGRARRGIALAEGWKSAKIPSAGYWNAVFISFEAEVRAGNSPIPTNMMKALKKIKAGLADAVKTAPESHFYGPNRVLGIIDLSAPKIAGGNPERAFVAFTDALAGAPKSTLNQLWYAKALIKLKRRGEAEPMLKKIAALTRAEMDPNWIPETEEDRAEAAKILAGRR